MKLDHDLSFLKEISKNDLKLISGGGTVSISSNGEYSSSSSVSSSFAYSSRDGVSSGGGRTARKITINGVVVKSEDKSFTFGPINGPFSFSFSSDAD